jgi:hypothetical protein
MEETDDEVSRNPTGPGTPHGRSSPACQLLLLIVETFVPAGACVDLVIDETLERRWGSKIEPPGALSR